MHKDYDNFIDSIQNKKCVRVTFDSHEKGIIQRKCIPFDFAISRRYKDGVQRFHFYDLESPDGNHNLSLLPPQLISLDVLNEYFEPSDYVTWDTQKSRWSVSRDWGIHS
jgi:hypothetical protein